ncbi:hypothetical protein [uncultured Kordia sp.]|uniref:hypothetical protein n=1 Tax=uncultured Kordia sp. TaxID=507699 RepID=UPI00262FCAEC|nr:hypothetical protein [uncultured Kordia sp.]
MKKKMKTLVLKKKTISDLQEFVRGGEQASGGMSCKTYTQAPPPPITKPAFSCRDTVHGWCDSRFGGCDTYYCPPTSTLF